MTTTTNRKSRALLAGGLVLGLGAAVTLATWSASEFANSTFTAGSFSIESSVDNGATYAEHVTSPGAGLTFGVNAANLTPTDVVYAPYSLRLGKTATTDATVNIAAAAGTGAVTSLSYTVVKAPTCDAAGVAAATGADVLVPAGTAVGTATGATAFDLVKSADGTADAAAANLCIAVTAGADLAQGQTGNAVWSFDAVSK